MQLCFIDIPLKKDYRYNHVKGYNQIVYYSEIVINKCKKWFWLAGVERDKNIPCCIGIIHAKKCSNYNKHGNPADDSRPFVGNNAYYGGKHEQSYRKII